MNDDVNDSSLAFRTVFGEVSMAERLLRQAMNDEGGFHMSEDKRKHYSIKNSKGHVTGHLYEDCSSAYNKLLQPGGKGEGFPTM